MHPERRLVDVLPLHTDLMVAGPEIELGEEPSAMEFIQEFIDDRDGESVLDGDGIQRAVVDTESPRASVFLTRRTGDENAELLRRIIPRSSMAAH
jgi:NAD(P)H-hydrate repair Nnr-like enzyme with NAD(P)H-hydrate dehydratase domain